VLSPDEVRPSCVFIFDDVACEKQDDIRNYFSMGRHKMVDCFYLWQTYTRMPKHLVRDNANLVILFKRDETNVLYVMCMMIMSTQICPTLSSVKYVWLAGPTADFSSLTKIVNSMKVAIEKDLITL